MKGNKIFYEGIAILILGIGFAAGTYAYYQTQITGSASGTVLAWWCKANGDSATFNLSLGSLKPGSSGELDVAITSSMAADYQMAFSNFENMGSGSNHPNLKLYRTKTNSTTYSNEIVDGSTVPPTPGTTTLSGSTYSATEKIYYYWPYGTSAENYNSAAPSAKITITCTQAQ